MKKAFILLSFLFIVFGVVACQEETTTEIITVAPAITLLDNQVELSINSDYAIDYSLNFVLKESETIAFSTSNEEVATVSMLGIVTGIGYGECDITLTYNEDVETVLHVLVSRNYIVTKPDKTVYHLNDEIDLDGASLSIYDAEASLLEEVSITEEMLLDFNPEETGYHIIQFEYEGLIYGFEIYILNEKQEASLFDDFFYLNTSLEMGEKVEFAITKSNLQEFLGLVENVYDYEEVNIYALIKSPSNEMKKVYAFWYQDYEERLTEITINTNLRLEGTVNDMEDDLDVFLQYQDNGNPHFRLRFLPEEVGEYTSTLVVEIDGIQIQTIEKSFIVEAATDDDFKGYLEVDASNNRHFIFDNGETYVAVGQNVAWYTSVERKYYDYATWFRKMNEVGMNYARVWMAAWGFSPFWNDIFQYDQRQTNLYSLDRTLDLADDYDLYIQLCLLHHGMFSEEVNPMWPGSENTWYTTKYGSNPYADVMDNPGLFFASKDIKDIFKNQLKYIISRYGYSDNIMSWELFNEVDWIETYSALAGNRWHEEMAQYIDSIDPNQHMITTSLNNQSFLSSNYQVFAIDEIDYVNVHHYGIYNHLDTLPDRQIFVYEVFGKPVIYDEVGYSGMGGTAQYEADPNNVTLHQQLWAGAMGGGAGTGMNWWWESWIERYDAYDAFAGIAVYSQYLDLHGESYRVLCSEDGDYNDLDISGLISGYIGYLVDNRLYLYVYDKNYNLAHPNPQTKSGITLTIPNLQNGMYTYQAFNTFTGEIIHSETIAVGGDSVEITIPNYQEDIAIIVEIIA